MNEHIIQFIEKQKCASLCSADAAGNLHCFSCFYAFNAVESLLYFKSSSGTDHIKMLTANPQTAGTILPDKLQVLAVKGVQFRGTLLLSTDPLAQDAATQYHKKFPLALAMSGDVWTIQLTWIKMTDSSMGFGKKLQWSRNEKEVV